MARPALTRDDILSKSKRPKAQVELPEMGGFVWVQGLTGAERDRYEQSIMERKRDGRLVPNLSYARARLVAISLVDEHGMTLFREDELEALNEIPARTLQKVWEKASELSGLSEEDVDELEKTSGTVPTDGSSSDSPSNSDAPSPSWPTESAAKS